MEIEPGRGIAGGVSLGQSRAAVAAALGQPLRDRGARVFYDALVLTFDAEDLVELIEVPYGEPEVTLAGVQLTARRMEDDESAVVEDVAVGAPSYFGF